MLDVDVYEVTNKQHNFVPTFSAFDLRNFDTYTLFNTDKTKTIYIAACNDTRCGVPDNALVRKVSGSTPPY